jgi:hypothetical protein
VWPITPLDPLQRKNEVHVRHWSLCLLLLLSFASACQDRFHVRPTELRRLDGYDVQQRRAAVKAAIDGQPLPAPIRPHGVIDDEGRVVLLGGDDRLYLHLGQRTIGGEFRSIAVSDGEFRGVLSSGFPVREPLAAVQSAEITRDDPRATAKAIATATTIGALLGVLAVVVGIAAAAH